MKPCDNRVNVSVLINTLLYSIQYLVIGIANCAAVPVVVGTSLGLNAEGIAGFAQRTLFFSGIACLLQAIWGHRYPIFEGPAGVWFSTFLVLSGMAVQVGKPLSVLRTDLETGLIVAGILTILLGVFRLMPLVRRLFTPIVNGVFLILLALQFSSTVIKGLLEPTSMGAQILALNKVAVFFVTIGVTFFVSLKSRGFLQSIAVLVGSTVGWIVALLLGLMPEFQGRDFGHLAIFSLPRLLDWGTPTFDPLITLTSVIAGLVVLSNLVASVAGMQQLTGDPDDGRVYNKTAVCTGVADIIAGLGCVVGFVPFASSVGFAALTGIFDRIPFVIGSIFQIMLGIIPAVGCFLAKMPITVGYAVLFAMFTVILGLGIQNCAQLRLGTREMVILGASILVGNAINFLPIQSFGGVLRSFSYLLSNGLIVGVTSAIVLEHVVFPRKTTKIEQKIG